MGNEEEGCQVEVIGYRPEAQPSVERKIHDEAYRLGFNNDLVEETGIVRKSLGPNS